MDSKDEIRRADRGEGSEQPPGGRSEKSHGTNRRRFLGAGLLAAGSLAYVKPAMAVTRAGSTGYGPLPITLPFHHSGPIPGGPGTHRGSMYTWSGTALLDIGITGVVTLQQAVLAGSFVSGTNFGPVTISLLAPASGSYMNTQFAIPTANLQVQDSSGTTTGTGSASGEVRQGDSSVNSTATTANGNSGTTTSKSC